MGRYIFRDLFCKMVHNLEKYSVILYMISRNILLDGALLREIFYEIIQWFII